MGLEEHEEDEVTQPKKRRKPKKYNVGHRVEKLKAEWKPVLDELIGHLYSVRVASTYQLYRLINSQFRDSWNGTEKAKRWTVRHRMDQLKMLHQYKVRLMTYDHLHRKWINAPNSQIYSLDRETARQFEIDFGGEFYLNDIVADPTPHKDSRNKYVLLTELYIQFLEIGVEELFYWYPNVVFLDRFNEIKERNPSPKQPRLLGGLMYQGDQQEHHLVGLSIYTGNGRNFKRYMEWVIPNDNAGLYDAVVFVPKAFQEKALDKSKQDHPLAWILPYEWSVHNPKAVVDAIRWNGFYTMLSVLEPYRLKGGHIEQVDGVAPTYRWEVTKQDGRVEYVDTTIGRPVGTIKAVASENTDDKHDWTLWCTTEEEVKVWKRVAEESMSKIDFRVLDDEILSCINVKVN